MIFSDLLSSMEGETSELENLDSELVMSFYDQYHADDMSKVYEDFGGKLEDAGVHDLKSSLAPDVATQTTQVGTKARISMSDPFSHFFIILS